MSNWEDTLQRASVLNEELKKSAYNDYDDYHQRLKDAGYVPNYRSDTLWGGLKESFLSGAGGIIGGIADFTEHEFGIGGDLADSLHTYSMLHAPRYTPWQKDHSQYFSSNYFTSPDGFVNDVGNALGSAAAIVPAGVAAAYLAPEGLIAGGVTALGSGAMAAAANAGSIVRDNKEAGKSKEEIDKILGKAAPEIIASGAAEGLLTTAMLPVKYAGKAMLGGTKIAQAAAAAGGETLGRKAIKITARSIANSVGESFQEALEQNVQNKYTGKEFTNTWYDPSTWTDDMTSAAFSAGLGSLPMAGFGHTVKAFQGTPQVSPESVSVNGVKARPQQQEAPTGQAENVNVNVGEGVADSFNISDPEVNVTETWQGLQDKQEQEMKMKKEKAIFDEMAEMYYNPSQDASPEEEAARRDRFASAKQHVDDQIQAFRSGRITRGELTNALNTIKGYDEAQETGLSDYITENLSGIYSETGEDRNFDQLNEKEQSLYQKYNDRLGEINREFYEKGGFENEENAKQYKDSLNQIKDMPEVVDLGFHKAVQSRINEVHEEEKKFKTAGEEYKEEQAQAGTQESSGRSKRSAEETPAEGAPVEEATTEQATPKQAATEVTPEERERTLRSLNEKDQKLYKQVEGLIQTNEKEFHEKGGANNKEALAEYKKALENFSGSKNLQRIGIAKVAQNKLNALNQQNSANLGENTQPNTKDTNATNTDAKNTQNQSNTNPQVTANAEAKPKAQPQQNAQTNTQPEQQQAQNAKKKDTPRPKLGEFNEDQLNSYMEEVAIRQLGGHVPAEHARSSKDVRRVIRNAERAYANGEIDKANYKKRLRNQLKQEKSKHVGLSDFIQSRLDEIDGKTNKEGTLFENVEETKQESPKQEPAKTEQKKKATQKKTQSKKETKTKSSTKKKTKNTTETEDKKKTSTKKGSKEAESPDSVQGRRKRYRENIHQYIDEAINVKGETVMKLKKDEVEKALKAADEYMDQRLKAFPRGTVLEYLQKNKPKFSNDNDVQEIIEDYAHRILNVISIDEGSKKKTKLYNVEKDTKLSDNPPAHSVKSKWNDLLFATRYMTTSNVTNIDRRNVPNLTKKEKEILDKINKATGKYQDARERHIRKLQYLEQLKWSTLGRNASEERIIEEQEKFFDNYFSDKLKDTNKDTNTFFRFKQYSREKMRIEDIIINEVIEAANDERGLITKRIDNVLDKAQERVVEYFKDYAVAYDEVDNANEGVFATKDSVEQSPSEYVEALSKRILPQEDKKTEQEPVDNFMKIMPSKETRSKLTPQELHSVYSIIARGCINDNPIRIANAITERNLWKTIKGTNSNVPASVTGNLKKPIGAAVMNYVEWEETQDNATYEKYQEYVKAEAKSGLKRFAAKYDFEMAALDSSGTLKWVDFRAELDKYIYDLPGFATQSVRKIIRKALADYGPKPKEPNSYRDVEAAAKAMEGKPGISDKEARKAAKMMSFKYAYHKEGGDLFVTLSDDAKSRKLIARFLTENSWDKKSKTRDSILPYYMPRWATERLQNIDQEELQEELDNICRNDGLGIQMTNNIKTFKEQLHEYFSDLIKGPDGAFEDISYSESELYDKAAMFLMRYPLLDASNKDITKEIHNVVSNFPERNLRNSVFGKYSAKQITNDILTGNVSQEQLEKLIEMVRTPSSEITNADRKVWEAVKRAFVFQAENSPDIASSADAEYMDETNGEMSRDDREDSLEALDKIGEEDYEKEMERRSSEILTKEMKEQYKEEHDEKGVLKQKENGKFIDREKYEEKTNISGLSDDEIEKLILELHSSGDTELAIQVLGKFHHEKEGVGGFGRWVPRYSTGMKEFDEALLKEMDDDKVWENTKAISKRGAQKAIREAFKKYVPSSDEAEKYIIPKSLENVYRKTIKEFGEIAEFDKDTKKFYYQRLYEINKKEVARAYKIALVSPYLDEEETLNAATIWGKAMRALTEDKVVMPERNFDFVRGIDRQLERLSRNMLLSSVEDVERVTNTIINLERAYKERLFKAASIGRSDLIPKEVRKKYPNPEEDTNILPESKHQIPKEIIDNLPMPKDVKRMFDEAKMKLYNEVLRVSTELSAVLKLKPKVLNKLKEENSKNFIAALKSNSKNKSKKYMELRKAYEKKSGIVLPDVMKVTRKKLDLTKKEQELQELENDIEQLEKEAEQTSKEIKNFSKNAQDIEERIEKMLDELEKEAKNRKPGEKLGNVSKEDMSFYDGITAKGDKEIGILRTINTFITDRNGAYTKEDKIVEEKIKDELMEEHGYSRSLVDRLFRKERAIYNVNKRKVQGVVRIDENMHTDSLRKQMRDSEILISAVNAVRDLKDSSLITAYEMNELINILKKAPEYVLKTTNRTLRIKVKQGLEKTFNQLLSLGLNKTLYRTPLDPDIYEQRANFYGYDKLMTEKDDIMKALDDIDEREKFAIQNNDYGGIRRVYKNHGLNYVIDKEESRVNRVQILLAMTNSHFIHPSTARDVLNTLLQEGSINHNKYGTQLYGLAQRFIEEVEESLVKTRDGYGQLTDEETKKANQAIDEFYQKIDNAKTDVEVNDAWLAARKNLENVFGAGVHSNEFRQVNRELMRQRDTRLASLYDKTAPGGKKFINDPKIAKRVNNAFSKGYATRSFSEPFQEMIQELQKLTGKEANNHLSEKAVRGEALANTLSSNLGKIVAVDLTNKQMAKDNVVFVYLHEKGKSISEDIIYRYKKQLNELGYKFVVAQATQKEGGGYNVEVAPVQRFDEEMVSTVDEDRWSVGSQEHKRIVGSSEGESGVRVHRDVSSNATGDNRTGSQEGEGGLRGDDSSVGSVPRSEESGEVVHSQSTSGTGENRGTLRERSGTDSQGVEQTSKTTNGVEIGGHFGKPISKILLSAFSEFEARYDVDVHDTIAKLVNDLGIQFIHHPQLMNPNASKQADVFNRIINSVEPYEHTSEPRKNERFARELVHEVSHIVTHMAMHSDIQGSKNIIQLARKGLKSLVTETDDKDTVKNRNYHTTKVNEMIHNGDSLVDIDKYIKSNSLGNPEVNNREKLALAGVMLQEVEASGKYTLNDLFDIDSIHSPQNATILHETIGYHAMTDEGLRDFIHFVNNNQKIIELGRDVTQEEIGQRSIDVPVAPETIPNFPKELHRFSITFRAFVDEKGGYKQHTIVIPKNEWGTATKEEKEALRKYKKMEDSLDVLVIPSERNTAYSVHADPEIVKETKKRTPLGMIRDYIVNKFAPNGDVRVLSGQLKGQIKFYHLQKVFQDTHRMIERYAPEFLDYYKLGQQAEDINSEHTRQITEELDGHFGNLGKKGTKEYEKNKEEFNKLASEIDGMGREFVQPVNINGKTYLITHADRLYETYDTERAKKWENAAKKDGKHFISEFDKNTGKHVFISSSRELKDVSYMGDRIYTVAMEQSRNLALKNGYSENVWKAYEGARMTMLKWLKKAQAQQRQLGMDKKDRIKIRWGYFPHFHDRWGIYEERVGSRGAGRTIVSAIESFQNRDSAVERARQLKEQGRRVVVIERGRNYTIPASHDNFMMDSLELPDTLITEVNESGDMYLNQNDVESLTGDIGEKKDLIIKTLRENGFVDGVKITKEEFISMFNPSNYGVNDEAKAAQLQDALTMFTDIDELFRGYNHKMPVAELVQKIENYGGRFKSLHRARRRMGKAGYNQDHLNNVYRYTYSMGNYLAWNPFVKLSTKQYENVFGVAHGETPRSDKEDLVSGFISRASGMPNTFDKLINKCLADLPFGDQITNKFGDQAATDFLRGNLQLMAMLKLGFRPAAGLTQLTQLITVASYYPSSEFKAGLMMALKPTEEHKRLFRELQLDQRMQSHGTDVFDGSRELFDKHFMGMSLGKMIEKSLFLVTKGDAFSRKVSAVIEYERQKKAGKTYQECVQEARYMARKVNGDNGRMDEAALFYGLGMLGRVLTQFKKFPLKQLNLIQEMNGRQKAKYFTLLGLMGGMFGYPFMSVLMALPGAFGYEEPLEDEIKGFILELGAEDPAMAAVAKFIMYGAPGMGGVDISQSVSLSDIIPEDTNSLLGPTFATYRDVWRALLNYDSMSDKAVATGAALSPAFWNVYQSTKGEFIKRKDLSVNREYGVGDRFLKLMGFRPTEDSLLYDVNRVRTVQERSFERKKKEAIQEYVEDRTSENLHAAYEAGATKDDIKKALKAQKENKIPIKKRPKNMSEQRRKLYERHQKLDSYLN